MADKDLLQEITETRTFAETELADQREEARKDRLCVGGKVWEAMDPDGVKERRDNKRPFLNSDEINQYLNQSINDVRANPRGIKYAPTGNGANDAGAEFYQNHVREIEYRSKASMVYAHAFSGALTDGIGWLQIKVEREHARTFNQNLTISLVANSDQVLRDPSAVWQDFRDGKFLHYIEPWPRAAFASQFPKAKASRFSTETARLAPGWVSREIVQVGEYWKLEAFPRRLVGYRHPDGTEATALVDELPDGKLPAGVENLREDDVDDVRVKCWITNGVEILREKKWLPKYIPFVSCMGKIVYIDGKQVVLSMTRLMREPAMFHAYALTCAAEAIGGVPRAQFIGYKGQFSNPKRWMEASRRPVAFNEVEPTVDGAPMDTVLPLPQRQPWDPPIQNLEMAIEARRRGIQAAAGISPQPTDTQRRTDVSGKAWDRREAMGQKGSAHFVDSFDLMIERTGMILEDAIPHYLDAARDIPIRLAGDKAAIVRVNDPSGSAYNAQRQLSGDPIFTKGDYRCTVSVGAADASQRESADAFVDTLVSNLQAIAQLAGPQTALKLLAQSVRVKQLGPIGDEIAELLDPPQMGQDGKPLPPAMMKLLGENKQLQQLLQHAQMEKQGKVVETQGRMQIEQVKQQHEDLRAAMDREVKIAVAEITAQAKQALQDMALFYEERSRIGAHLHEQALGSQDAVRASADARRAEAHTSLENARQQLSDHVGDEMNHQRAVELASHTASLQPEPAAPAEGV